MNLMIPTWILHNYGLRGWILQHPTAEESPLHTEVNESAHIMGTTSNAGKDQLQAGQVGALGYLTKLMPIVSSSADSDEEANGVHIRAAAT